MLVGDTLNAMRSYGGAFRWGSGLLGKSAIVVGPLVVGLLVLAWESHSDLARFGFALLAVGTFFGWFVPFIKFCEKHPADALLEGVHWAQHQQVLLAAKEGFPQGILDAALCVSTTGAIAPKPIPDGGEQKS